jgi:formylglycine-generating enzyme required for sulfatase activity
MYTEKTQGLHFNMIPIKGGTFIMGNLEYSDRIIRENDMGFQSVKLSSYWIGETPVTFDDWYTVMGNHRIKKGELTDMSLPVIDVSWDEAKIFIKKLNAFTGQKYRFPTEAEWEYAARERGQNVLFGNGKEIADPNEINFNPEKQSNREGLFVKGIYRQCVTPVKSFAPNALGLYDMSGNVQEWCHDCEGTIYDNTTVKNPKGNKRGKYKIVRGGSWFHWSQFCTAYTQSCERPYNSNSKIGFRLALTKPILCENT